MSTHVDYYTPSVFDLAKHKLKWYEKIIWQIGTLKHYPYLPPIARRMRIIGIVQVKLYNELFRYYYWLSTDKKWKFITCKQFEIYVYSKDMTTEKLHMGNHLIDEIAKTKYTLDYINSLLEISPEKLYCDIKPSNNNMFKGFIFKNNEKIQEVIWFEKRRVQMELNELNMKFEKL